jgi:hypothetical protein
MAAWLSVSSSPIYAPFFRIPLSTHQAVPRSDDGVRGETRTHIGASEFSRRKQMLRRVFPLLKRPDVEFMLECASFILFSAALHALGRAVLVKQPNQAGQMRMTHDVRPSPKDVPHSQNL